MMMRSVTSATVLLCLPLALAGCSRRSQSPQAPAEQAQREVGQSDTQGNPRRQADADQLLQRAKEAKDRKDLDTALRLVDEALAAQAGHIEANWLKAWLLVGKDQAEPAIQQFELVLQLGLDAERTRQAREALERLRKRAGKPLTPATRPAPVRAAPVAEWPGWRGPDRDGKSPDKGLLKQWPTGGPKLLWRASGLGAGFSSVAVASGRVYTTGDVGGQTMVSAFDMNGKSVWRAQLDAGWTNVPGSRSTPVVDGGKLYILSGPGLVGCYEAGTGKRLWTRKMSEFGGSPGDWGYAESVLIHGNLAIVTPGGEQCIVALDKNAGQTVWTSSGFSAGAQYGSCIAADYGGVTTIVAGTRDGIVGVSAKDGRLLWQNGFAAGNTANCPTPAYADGHVFWAVGYGKGGICLRLEGSGGRVSAGQAWATRDMDCHHGGYILHDGYIYGNNDGGWACLDLKTGKKQWQAQGVGKGSVCFADGMLYLFSENGGAAALATCSPSGLQITGRLSVQGSGQSWAHPAVIGGRLYLRYDDNLYCYDVKG